MPFTRRDARLSIERALEEMGLSSTWGSFEVWRTRDGRSEWSSNVAHRLRLNREETARLLQVLLEDARANNLRWRIATEKGFINFHMNEAEQNHILEQARQKGESFGRGESLRGQRINVEWVSADPSGPLSAQAARIALAGEALCRVLESQGAQVTREYFQNDDANSSKARSLGESVLAWYLSAFESGKDFMADLEDDPAILSSEWVRSVAREAVREDGNKWLLAPRDEARTHFIARAREAALASQKASLAALGVRFDVWTSEAALLNEGRVQVMLDKLGASGHLYERQDSQWLKTSERGDETDRPLVRRGRPTYLATDIAYHAYKFSRGFGRIINIWTSQHRPYVARTRAALELAGLDASAVQVLACEGVRPRRDGIALAGEGAGVSADHLIEDAPVDALKYFLIAPTWEDVAVLEVETASRDDEANPAYSIQLAPSRLSLLANELEVRVDYAMRQRPIAEDFQEWTPTEKSLRRLVALWPDELEASAQNLEPQRVARFALELAQVAREDLNATRAATTFERAPEELAARLALLQAARSVARQALTILNITPREHF